MKIDNEILIIKINKEKLTWPVERLSESVNTSYCVGLNELEPFFENVSQIIQHLVMTRNINREMIQEIEILSKTKFPDSEINWENTHLMVNYVKEFKSLFAERISEMADGLKGGYINVLDPDRLKKRLLIKAEISKKLNKKYNTGMYSLPSVPLSLGVFMGNGGQ